MQIDPRLNEIDDCLYRVAIRAIILQDNKLLLIREKDYNWWAVPGGGVAHGETIESTLSREVEEELGVPAKEIATDFQVVYYNIGNVVNGIPRMNIYYKVSMPERLLQKTDHIAEWQWFTKEEFLASNLHPSYNKLELADVIF